MHCIVITSYSIHYTKLYDDRFSNRKEQAEKENAQKINSEDDIPVFVPPIGAEAAGAAATGFAALSGLPGIDKFSNRKEQAEKKLVEQQQSAAEEAARQTIEDDPFGIRITSYNVCYTKLLRFQLPIRTMFQA